MRSKETCPNVLFVMLGFWLCRYMVVVTKVPGPVLGPMILVLSMIGTYAFVKTRVPSDPERFPWNERCSGASAS